MHTLVYVDSRDGSVIGRREKMAILPPTRGWFNHAQRQATTERMLYSAFLPVLANTSSAEVAQLVEHVTENHGVGGSIPSLGTILP